MYLALKTAFIIHQHFILSYEANRSCAKTCMKEYRHNVKSPEGFDLVPAGEKRG